MEIDDAKVKIIYDSAKKLSRKFTANTVGYFPLGGFGRLKDRVVLPAAVFAAWLNRINKVRKKSGDDRYVGKNMYFCTQ